MNTAALIKHLHESADAWDADHTTGLPGAVLRDVAKCVRLAAEDDAPRTAAVPAIVTKALQDCRDTLEAVGREYFVGSMPSRIQGARLQAQEALVALRDAPTPHPAAVPNVVRKALEMGRNYMSNSVSMSYLVVACCDALAALDAAPAERVLGHGIVSDGLLRMVLIDKPASVARALVRPGEAIVKLVEVK